MDELLNQSASYPGTAVPSNSMQGMSSRTVVDRGLQNLLEEGMSAEAARKAIEDLMLSELAFSNPAEVCRIILNREYNARSRERKEKYREELEHSISTVRNEINTKKAHITYVQNIHEMLRRSNYEWRKRLNILEEYGNQSRKETEILKSKLWNLILLKEQQQLFMSGDEATSSGAASQNVTSRAEVEFANILQRENRILASPAAYPQEMRPPPSPAVLGYRGQPSSVPMQYPPRPDDPPAPFHVPPPPLSPGMLAPSGPVMPHGSGDVPVHASPSNPQQPTTTINQQASQQITITQQEERRRGHVISEVEELNTLTAAEDYDFALLVQRAQAILQQQQDAAGRVGGDAAGSRGNMIVANAELDNIPTAVDYDLALLVQQAQAILQQEQDAAAEQEGGAADQEEQI